MPVPLSSDFRTQRWYARPNDLIGGYSVNNADKSASELDAHAGEFEVALFVDEPVARYMAGLHNARLAGTWAETFEITRLATADLEPGEPA